MNWYGRNSSFQSCTEDNIFNFFLMQRSEIHTNQFGEQLRVWQSSAPRKSNENSEYGSGPTLVMTLNQLKRSHEDVETGNDEDEDPLETEVSKARMNQNRTCCVQKLVCCLSSKVEDLVDNIEFICWRKRKEKERLRLLPLITVS